MPGVLFVEDAKEAGPGSYLNLAKALGADAIYSKPFSINDLIAKIEELLNIEQNT